MPHATAARRALRRLRRLTAGERIAARRPERTVLPGRTSDEDELVGVPGLILDGLGHRLPVGVALRPGCRGCGASSVSDGWGMLLVGSKSPHDGMRMMNSPVVGRQIGAGRAEELDEMVSRRVVTGGDLDWWVACAATLEWTFARTYAATAPHSYVVLGRTEGMAAADYVRAGRVIHTFGQPGKFYGMTSIYLTSPDGRVKWWTMDRDVRDTTLINQATTDRLYGVQNAPSTVSGVGTYYDGLASAFDEVHPTSSDLAGVLRAAVASLSGQYPPAVLDVGCGTGRVLDLGLTTPERYAGVDPSQPMLNQLVRKHPTVAAVYPMTVEQALARRLFTPGQFEIVTLLLDPADILGEGVEQVLTSIASRGVIAARGDEVRVIDSRHLRDDSGA